MLSSRLVLSLAAFQQPSVVSPGSPVPVSSLAGHLLPALLSSQARQGVPCLLACCPWPGTALWKTLETLTVLLPSLQLEGGIGPSLSKQIGFSGWVSAKRVLDWGPSTAQTVRFSKAPVLSSCPRPK